MSNETKIVDFLIKYSSYTDRKLIKEYIKKHLEYKTCDFAIDKQGEVMFVCRWNIQGITAFVADLIINPKYKGIKTIKWILARNWKRFPYVRFLRWKRKDNKTRIYNIKQFLKEE